MSGTQWTHVPFMQSTVFLQLLRSIFFLSLRGSGEELQARGGGPDAEHHHGAERPHEDPGAEQAGDLRDDPGGLHRGQGHPCHADEADQAERIGRYLQVVG